MKFGRSLAGVILAAILVASLSSCNELQQDDNMNAVGWVRGAEEYRAICQQSYAAATRQLERALKDKAWSASLEQLEQGDFAAKKPAIIVDVDETVLDNSPYQAKLVQEGKTYSPDSWRAWTKQALAEPIPGALSFLSAADKFGITIFYVTNRSPAEEADTRRNLSDLGFPLPNLDIDLVLTKGEYDDEGSEKGPRRMRVAKSHRILFMFGDDMGDFASRVKKQRQERQKLMLTHSTFWGEKWFMLPNPTYGSWARLMESEATIQSPTIPLAEAKRRWLKSHNGGKVRVR